MAAAAGMVVGRRGRALRVSTFPGAGRCVGAVPVARQRPGPQARRLARVGSAASRASQSSRDSTTYHYWATYGDARRGPGYLRRWIAGETVGSRIARAGADD